jgi:hypothetical protein
MKLTNLEKQVIEGAQKSDYGDVMNGRDGTWSFDVQEYSKLNEKIYRGVVSSLVKKGLVTISDSEGHGKYRDMVFDFTDKCRNLVKDGKI